MPYTVRSKTLRRFLCTAIILILCAALLLCALPSVRAARQTIPSSLQTWNPYKNATYSHAARFAGYTLVTGIDISEFNTVTDWNAVKASGIDYVILRGGFRWSSSGRVQIDERFQQYIQGALAAGLEVGVYFYTEATSPQEAVEEANALLSWVAPYAGRITLPLVIDFEFTNQGRLYDTCMSIYDSQGKDAARAHGTAICQAFCQTISAAGYTPMVYADRNRLENWLYASQIETFAKIWVASWDTFTTYAGEYFAWQHTSTARVNGINGNVDCNFFYLPPETSGTDPTPTPTPTPTPAPTLTPTVTQQPGEDGELIQLISGFPPGMTYRDIYAAMQADATQKGLQLSFLDAGGNPRAETDTVCTGDLLVFSDAQGDIVESNTILLYGDVYNDGKIDLLDVMDIHQFLCNTKEPAQIVRFAADLNHDGKIDLLDVMDIRQHICGTKIITQQ